MKKSELVGLLLGAVMVSSGCATKNYVRNTVVPIQAKLDQVGEQTNRNAAAIEENRREIKAVDERAESGIGAAKERAMTAENKAAEAANKAAEAMKKAIEAANAATEARARSDKNSSELESLRNAVGDDYKVVIGTTVHFALGQDKLSAESKEELDKLVAGKRNLKRFVVVVEGFTDRVGSVEYNNALSLRRADSVVNYLLAKHEIPLHRISRAGLGSEKPADEGGTRTARSKNRRVEVKVFSADQTTAATVTR